ncbi:diadenylate cyclase CdaM [Mycoplasmoides gallisepticum]|uniref:diadenylate cyclase CdaM n=1 Tax=Mycoplasmoides gallisepticum TaxID=2096 RepID=UPI0007FC35C8|nr:diadenylate cyclase CdaM [Mycoplasmoides gallisepticum]OBU79207.1 TIGR00159 family protein [Mycoplasmoides gallisepticum]
MQITTLLILILIAFLVIMVVSIIQFIIFIFTKKAEKESFFNFFKKYFKKKQDDRSLNDFYDNLSSSLLKLSADKIGGIIAIEREDNLDYYINVGYKIMGEFSPEFIISVFYNKNSPLHDGGIIIRDMKMVSISSYFPMTQQLLDVSYGARHRAGVGLSEKSDAIVFIVSETNGKISVAQKGRIKRLSNNPERLFDEIIKLLDDKKQRDFF